MGKGFVLDGVDDQDLATLFHQAFKRKVSIQHRLFFDTVAFTLPHVQQPIWYLTTSLTSPLFLF